MKVLRKILTWVVLPLAIIALAYVNVDSIMQPVQFNKHKDYRQGIAVQRLKDIRDLQVAYKSVTGKFCSSLDSLVEFYNNGKMPVVMQIGSVDDTVAYMRTKALEEKIKKANKKLTKTELNEKLYEYYQKGETNIVFNKVTEVPVKDTLFTQREKFVIDSIKYIPFSGGEIIEMEAVVKEVSGVNVPLFEARIPFKKLLKGLDNQLRINLDQENRDKNLFEGLQVGSISAPNNNAGNWE